MFVNGVELIVEDFGERANPAIVLIGGAGSSMDVWDTRFCQRLAAARFVLRYDQRDTGGSTTDKPGEPSYRFPDLVADVVGILDQYGIEAAHLAGVSMGGAVAQLTALDRRPRVASLTLIATSTGRGGPELPGMTAELAQFFADHDGPADWSDRPAVVDYLVALEGALSGVYFDEEATRGTMTRVVARSHDMRASMTNHMAVPRENPWRPRLSTLDIPTLVIHGTVDPLFPLAHGQALAAEIPGATLLAIPGMGHEAPPPPTWDVVIPAILAHTGKGVRDAAGR
jgi:pimeloyl-ACP methyl ester carboxylesterase